MYDFFRFKKLYTGKKNVLSHNGIYLLLAAIEPKVKQKSILPANIKDAVHPTSTNMQNSWNIIILRITLFG